MTRKQLKPYLFGALALALLVGTTGASAHMMGKAADNLTDEQLAVAEEARELRDAGSMEEAKLLLEEAGISHRGKGQMGHENEEIQLAVEQGDYQAFLAATTDAPFAEQIDEAFFSKIVEMQSLKESGELEAADAIREDLGLPAKMNKKRGHRGFNNLSDAEKLQLEEVRSLREAGDTEASRALMQTIKENRSEN